MLGNLQMKNFAVYVVVSVWICVFAHMQMANSLVLFFQQQILIMIICNSGVEKNFLFQSNVELKVKTWKICYV